VKKYLFILLINSGLLCAQGETDAHFHFSNALKYAEEIE